MQALIAPTETGYSLNEIKRAVLTYEKVFILDQGDRDLFPGTAMGMAMGMPPIMSMPGGGSVRPMGKASNYDSEFDVLMGHCKPLIDAGVLEVTSSWNRSETETDQITIGMVPLGGYQLNVQAVLSYYRALARDNAMLTDALDRMAVALAGGQDADVFTQQGQADGSINDDPMLPLLDGPLQREELRATLTAIARSRIATALKLWGVAEQRGLTPVLPEPSALILDRLAQSARAAIDRSDDDPYWSRRTAILDMVVSEFVPDDRLDSISTTDLLDFRTREMFTAAEERTKLFADVREMAGEKTNLNLQGFQDRIRERMAVYQSKIAELHIQRSALGWRMVLEVGKIATTAGAGIAAAGGLFHVALPVSLSAALLGGTAWGLGKVQENLPTIRKVLADEKNLQGSNEFAVFRKLQRLRTLG